MQTLEAEMEKTKAKGEKSVETWKKRAEKLRESMKEKEAAWKEEKAGLSGNNLEMVLVFF